VDVFHNVGVDGMQDDVRPGAVVGPLFGAGVGVGGGSGVEQGKLPGAKEEWDQKE
jgi:hypothetical protein